MSENNLEELLKNCDHQWQNLDTRFRIKRYCSICTATVSCNSEKGEKRKQKLVKLLVDALKVNKK